MEIPDIKIGVGIDMQKYYDDLVLMQKTIASQLKVLADDPSICTHKTWIKTGEITYCKNPRCHHVIDGGKFDCVN
jgi:hypothetical protein